MQDAPRKPRKPPVNPARTIETPDGPMTRAEAAAFYGIPKNTLIRRIWNGWPPERWFEPSYVPQRREKATVKYRGQFITPYGRRSLAQMAEIVGVSVQGMRARLWSMYWPFRDAFNTPSWGKPGVNFILPDDEYTRRLEAVLASDIKERVEVEQRRKAEYNRRRKAKRLREKTNAK